MKQLLPILSLCLLMVNLVSGQVKIGDNPQTLNPASILELESNSRVLVITRVNDAEMSTITPLRGALVYNTDQDCIHYYNGSDWINICEALDNSFTVSTRADYLRPIDPNAVDSTVVITPSVVAGVPNLNFEVGIINNANIGESAVTNSKIADFAIANFHIQPEAVTLEKFENGVNYGDLHIWDGFNWNFINQTDLRISEKDSIIGNEVTDATLDGSLMRLGGGTETDPYTLDVRDGGIGNLELAPDAVTTDKISDGTILEDDLADDAVTTTKILDGNVTLDKLADGTTDNNIIRWNGTVWEETNLSTGLGQDVTSTNSSITGIQPNAALVAMDLEVNVDGTTLDVDGTGVHLVDGGVTETKLADNAVTSAKIEDETIVDIDVSPTAAIQGTKIDPDFGTQDITTTGDLASGNTTITGTLSTTSTATIGAYTITDIDGAPGQVLTTNGTGLATWLDTSPTAIVTTGAFTGNGLSGSELDLADNAVTSAKIEDETIADINVSPTAAIQGTKIDPDFGTQDITTTGDLASGNTTITGTLSTTSTVTIGAFTVTDAIGAPGQVLTTDGGGSATWEDTSPTAIATTGAFTGNGLNGSELDLADDAVTSAKIEDETIVNEDVSPTAAIQGTKIDPDFGTQDITTTGDLASGNTTITGTLSTTSTVTIGAFTVTDAIGAPGQVLTTDGGGSATWEDTSPTAIATTGAFTGNGLTGSELDLADDAVTTDKILDETILEEDLADDAVTSAKIEDETIATVDIADDAITADKIAAGAVNALALNTDVAGNGLALNAGTNALEVDVAQINPVFQATVETTGSFTTINGSFITDLGDFNTTDGSFNTTTGDYKLAGTTIIVPDFVFENYYNGFSELKSDYQFKSLKEIEAFIKEHKHLPGVKSAYEIMNNGQYRLGESSLIHLEKIEELFLHTIEQEKKIENLQSENKKLSEELNALKADMQAIKSMLLNKTQD